MVTLGEEALGEGWLEAGAGGVELVADGTGSMVGVGPWTFRVLVVAASAMRSELQNRAV